MKSSSSTFSGVVWAVAVVLAVAVHQARAQCGLGKLLAHDGALFDGFGRSVAVSGGTAVIGAPWDDDNGENSGSAYVFRFDGSTWVEEQKLLAADGVQFEEFGWAVAISADPPRRMVIGAWHDNDHGPNSGSAYIFRFDGSRWVQQGKLLASDGVAYDAFGTSVAISGETALIGAHYRGFGSAYVFRYDGSRWVQEQKLQRDGDFGASVAIRGQTALIGAQYDDDNGRQSGSAYVFRFDGLKWVQAQKLLPADGEAFDRFGASLAISHDTALIGAWEGSRHGPGSAYVFRYNGSSWVQEQKLLADDGEDGDLFGWSVAVSADRALIGSYLADYVPYLLSGSAYLFRFDGMSWVQVQKLTPPDPQGFHRFGYSVAIDVDKSVIGAVGDNDNGRDAGAAYGFGLGDPCDMNCDGEVTALDIEPFLDLLFGSAAPCGPCAGDVNGDDSIDAFDIEPFLACLFPSP